MQIKHGQVKYYFFYKGRIYFYLYNKTTETFGNQTDRT